MRGPRSSSGWLFVLCGCFVTSAWAKKVPLVAPPGGPAGPQVQSGTDEITFQGEAVSIPRVPVKLALLVTSVAFVNADYNTIGEIQPGETADEALLGGGWVRAQRPRSMSAGVPGGAPAILRCQIPAAAQGMVVRYIGPTQDPHQITVTVNRKSAMFTTPAGPHETLLLLTTSGGKTVLADSEPITNYWDMRELGTLGADLDPCTKEIDDTNGNDPMHSHAYTLHVVYEPKTTEGPRKPEPTSIVLSGVDITGYDGYTFEVKSPVGGVATMALLDSSNFSWAAGAVRLPPNEWTKISVPMEAHRNLTVAGDGVLKLADVRRLILNVYGGRKDERFEYWVRPPQFYTGTPPADAVVATEPDLRRGADRECIDIVSAKERTAPFFSGISIQGMARQGNFIWLATNRGLIKCSVKQPGLALATFTMENGLVDDDVNAVMVDGDNVWVATTNGVARFDGTKFHNYTRDDGLLPGPAMVLGAEKNAVWVGMTRGIARIDKQTGKVASYRRRGGWAPESTGGQGVPIEDGRGVYADSLLVDTNGSIWHGAAGLDHTSTAARTEHYHGSTTRTIGIFPDDRDHLWWVTSGNVEEINKSDGEEVTDINARRRLGLAMPSPGSKLVTAVADGPRGLWLGYSDGLGWCDFNRGACFWSPKLSVALGALVPQTLLPVDDNLWVGTDNGLMVVAKADAAKPWGQLDYESVAEVNAAGVNLDDPETCACQLTPGQQAVYLAVGDGAESSAASLAMDFSLGTKPEDQCQLVQRFNLDLQGYAGLTFDAKTSDHPRWFNVDIVRDVWSAGRKGRRHEEVWRARIQVTTDWQRFHIPFATMQRITPGPAIPDNSARLSSININRQVGQFSCPGDTGTLWIDRLGWYQPDDVPQRVAEATQNR